MTGNELLKELATKIEESPSASETEVLLLVDNVASRIKQINLLVLPTSYIVDGVLHRAGAIQIEAEVEYL